MAVLWLILKGIGWVLLVLLALLIAALLVPVTAELCYEKGQFSAALRVLAVRVKLYPRPEKPEKPKKQKKPRRPKKAKPVTKKPAVQIAAKSETQETAAPAEEAATAGQASVHKPQAEMPEQKQAAPQPAARQTGRRSKRPERQHSKSRKKRCRKPWTGCLPGCAPAVRFCAACWKASRSITFKSICPCTERLPLPLRWLWARYTRALVPASACCRTF